MTVALTTQPRKPALSKHERDALRAVVRGTLSSLGLTIADLAHNVANFTDPTAQQLGLKLSREQWERAAVKWPIEKPTLSELATRRLSGHQWRTAVELLDKLYKREYQFIRNAMTRTKLTRDAALRLRNYVSDILLNKLGTVGYGRHYHFGPTVNDAAHRYVLERLASWEPSGVCTFWGDYDELVKAFQDFYLQVDRAAPSIAADRLRLLIAPDAINTFVSFLSQVLSREGIVRRKALRPCQEALSKTLRTGGYEMARNFALFESKRLRKLYAWDNNRGKPFTLSEILHNAAGVLWNEAPAYEVSLSDEMNASH